MTYFYLFFSLAIILCGAEIFTNGIEWLGKKLKLGEGAVGSILAAVGTALPETLLPVIAIFFGTGKGAEQIGIGAILGAPFMLSTLAMFVTGVTASLCMVEGKKREHLLCDPQIMRRDLLFFSLVYSAALLTAFLPSHVFKVFCAVGLVTAYSIYAYHTVKAGRSLEETRIPPLLFHKSAGNPSLTVILLQIATALGMVIYGAGLLITAITKISAVWNIPEFILAIVIAPIATELPEKFNSIVWIREGKDTLALGNITGAMVFQSSVVPAIGILLTPWELSPLALASGVLALISVLIIYLNLRLTNRLAPRTLMSVGSLYLIFLVLVFYLGGTIR